MPPGPGCRAAGIRCRLLLSSPPGMACPVSRHRHPGHEQVPDRGTDGPVVILVGVDGSPASLRALAYAAGFARRGNAELVCAYVHALDATIAPALVVNPALAPLAWPDDRLPEEIGACIGADCRTWGTPVRYLVRTGTPPAELTALADEVHADMIVVGAPGSPLRRLCGSLPARLARHRRWPVLIVP